MNKKLFLHVCIGLLVLAACSSDMNESLSIKGYDGNKLRRHTLEPSLQEISGICFDGSNNSFLAINDEQGVIFRLDTTYRITARFVFAGKGDYEEIHMLNDRVFVLRSDGTLFTMTYDGQKISNIRAIEYSRDKAEFESFYIAAANELVLIPKKSKYSDNTKSTTGIWLNLLDGTASESSFTVHWNALKSVSKIHPSAAAVHPISKDIYLLVSMEKRLLVLDPAWNVKEEYALDAHRFPQAEGITFDAQANMYITNEGGDDEPTLIFIPKK